MESKSIEKPLPTKFSKFTAEFPEKSDFFYIVDNNLKICCYSVETYKIFKKKVDNIKCGQIIVFYTTREHLLSVASQQWESGLSSVASQQWENGQSMMSLTSEELSEKNNQNNIEDSEDNIEKRKTVDNIINEFISFYREEEEKTKEEIKNIIEQLKEDISNLLYVKKNHDKFISNALFDEVTNDLGILPKPESELDDIYGNVNGDLQCDFCQSKEFKECYRYKKKVICGDCKQRYFSSANLSQFTLELHAKSKLDQ